MEQVPRRGARPQPRSPPSWPPRRRLGTGSARRRGREAAPLPGPPVRPGTALVGVLAFVRCDRSPGAPAPASETCCSVFLSQVQHSPLLPRSCSTGREGSLRQDTDEPAAASLARPLLCCLSWPLLGSTFVSQASWHACVLRISAASCSALLFVLHPLFSLSWVVFLALPCSSLRRAFHPLRNPLDLSLQVGQWGHSASPLPLWVLGCSSSAPRPLVLSQKSNAILLFIVKVFSGDSTPLAKTRSVPPHLSSL